MSRSSDLRYGRQGGRFVNPDNGPALDAIRTKAGAAWPEHSRKQRSDLEWQSAAGFARIRQALGHQLTAAEQEAIRRYPDEPAAGAYLRRDDPPTAAPAEPDDTDRPTLRLV